MYIYYIVRVCRSTYVMTYAVVPETIPTWCYNIIWITTLAHNSYGWHWTVPICHYSFALPDVHAIKGVLIKVYWSSKLKGEICRSGERGWYEHWSSWFLLALHIGVNTHARTLDKTQLSGRFSLHNFPTWHPLVALSLMTMSMYVAPFFLLKVD